MVVFSEQFKVCYGFGGALKSTEIYDTIDHKHFLSSVRLKDGSRVAVEKIFSNACCILMQGDFQCCPRCRRVKVNLEKRMTRLENCPLSINGNNRYMSRKQLEQKLCALKSGKILAAKKCTYWENRFKKESLVIEENQSEDFNGLLAGIYDKGVPESMKLLLAQQRKALQAKSAVGRRWHPR